MKSWYEAYKGRLQKELDALKSLEVETTIDEEAVESKVVRLRFQIEGANPHFDLPDKKPVDLEVIYPDNFPFFRPAVYSHTLDLPRHQDPIGKLLCLIPRSTEFWYPSLTVAEFLKEQLKKLLIKGNITDEKVIKADPDEQAEPVSEFYPHRNTPVIFDPTIFEVEFNDKEIIPLGKMRIGVPEKAPIPTRSAVLEVTDATGKVIGKAPGLIEKIFPNKVSGTIYKLPERPPFGDPGKDFEWLIGKLKGQGQRIDVSGPTYKAEGGVEMVHMFGLCFPEEIEPGKPGMGWLFMTLIKYMERIGKSNAFAKKEMVFYSKISRINKDEIGIRIPQLKALAEKTIAIIGLGALGAPSAIEFARNGVKELRLLDFDFVDAGTTVRWPLGIAVAGLAKTQVLKNFIELHYPYTKVVIENIRIGDIRITGNNNQGIGEKNQREVLDQFMTDVSLIYDSSAELGIMHYLSYEAESRALPYICIYGTEGALGGLLFRVVPGKNEACWMCMRTYQDDGTIKGPPADSSGKVQAIGCGDISFTGAGFDLQNISLAGVRMASSILCADSKNGYPELTSNVAVLSLVSDKGESIFPTWAEYKLPKHPKCVYCAED